MAARARNVRFCASYTWLKPSERKKEKKESTKIEGERGKKNQTKHRDRSCPIGRKHICANPSVYIVKLLWKLLHHRSSANRASDLWVSLADSDADF